MLGQWHCHGVGPWVLVSEGEGPNNQHDMEGEMGDGGGESMTKGRGKGVVQWVYVIKTIKNNTTYY